MGKWHFGAKYHGILVENVTEVSTKLQRHTRDVAQSFNLGSYNGALYTRYKKLLDHLENEKKNTGSLFCDVELV